MKLNDFHRANVARQHEAFAPPHTIQELSLCVQEEVGEMAGAILGVTGAKKRKAHKTPADVLDGVADAITYLSLVAAKMGCEDLEALLADTFNMVSDRAGSQIKIDKDRSIAELEARIAELESQIAALRGAELDARPAVEINVTDFEDTCTTLEIAVRFALKAAAEAGHP